MDLKKIRELMGALEKSKLQYIEVQEKDFRIKLKKPQVPGAAAPAPEEPRAPQLVPAPAPAEPLAATDPFVYVTSPIVGVFYAAPAPGEKSFVSEGDRVKKGDVICIVEAMKLMNEIRCEVDGTVMRILVQNEQSVQHGEKLVAIEPEEA